MKNTMNISLAYPGGIAIFDPDYFCDFLENLGLIQGNVFDSFVKNPEIGDAAIRQGTIIPIYPIDEDDYEIANLNHGQVRAAKWKFSHRGFSLAVRSGIVVATDIFSLFAWEHDFFRNYRKHHAQKTAVNDMMDVPPGNYAVTVCGGLVENTKTYGLLFERVKNLPGREGAAIDDFDFNI
jgi:hypothetical protein